MLLFVAAIIAGVFFLVGWGWRALTAPSAAATEAPHTIKIDVERRPAREKLRRISGTGRRVLPASKEVR
jgi:hypothetical protein